MFSIKNSINAHTRVNWRQALQKSIFRRPIKAAHSLTLASLIGVGLSVGGIAPEAHAALPANDSQGQPLPSLAPMLKAVNPAVVNISTFATNKEVYNPLLNHPFFRHYFDLPEQQSRPKSRGRRRPQSAGSGVIIDGKEGIVLTNYHVVKGADEVQVGLIDGRSFTAEVKGSDPDLDVAVLKIDAKDLKDVKLGNSSAIEIGDFVVAIGNPFGLGQTVTTGIVSALNRSVFGVQGYENYIQTDASINPGNSGGALVNLRGELVGINTAIIAPSGGNVGIGFAIPVNMAKASVDQILKHGEVKRGQIGVSIQDFTPELAREFDLENGQRGVLVADVGDATPAEKAGLEPGDIIVAVNGKATHSTGQLRSQIGIHNIGDTVKVSVLREGKTKHFNVKVGSPRDQIANTGKLHSKLEGVNFENHVDGKGVEVVSLLPNSDAAFAGLRPGDVIVGANRKRVYDIASFRTALKSSKKTVLLQVQRDGFRSFIVIR